MRHALGQKLCGGVAVALAVCVGLAMAGSFRPALCSSSGTAAQGPDSSLLARPPPQWSHPPRHWGGLVRCVYILPLGRAPPPYRSAMGKGCAGPQRPRVSLGEHLERRLCQQRGMDVWTAYSEPYAMATTLSAAAPGGPPAVHHAGGQLSGRRESLWRL